MKCTNTFTSLLQQSTSVVFCLAHSWTKSLNHTSSWMNRRNDWNQKSSDHEMMQYMVIRWRQERVQTSKSTPLKKILKLFIQLFIIIVYCNSSDGGETAYVKTKSRPSLWRVKTESRPRSLVFKCSWDQVYEEARLSRDQDHKKSVLITMIWCHLN